MSTFVPPTVEDVQKLCEKRGYPDYTEPQATTNDFLTYHTTNGWVRGRHHTPIKSWGGALTTWHRIEERIQSETALQRPEVRPYEPPEAHATAGIPQPEPRTEEGREVEQELLDLSDDA